ncbi:MAG: UDP-3-O-(3-hydroxymyristoyl)glucosamine N-acyltransferase [Longimicrobiales bacterium]
MKASEVARVVAGRIEGGADPDLTGVAPLDRATPSDLSFLSNTRYADEAAASAAGVLFVTEAMSRELPASITRIVVGDVYAALAGVLPLLYPPVPREPGIHPTAILEAGVVLGDSVRIGAYAVIRAGTRIGDRADVGVHCVVGRDCVVGEDAYLHPQVTLYDDTRLGARSILHSGVRIGVDGFGYHAAGGRPQKIPQVGNCIIGNDVEIGANTTIDRGSIGPTEIGDFCKIDNLVQIGHNVRIGAGTVIISQVGIAGSTRIGRGVTLAGQAGVNGHITIGDGARIAGQAGVFGDVPPGATYSGYPARPHREALRVQAAINRLPALLRQLRGGSGADTPSSET